jgi:lipoprotein-releasing system permease protein
MIAPRLLREGRIQSTLIVVGIAVGVASSSSSLAFGIASVLSVSVVQHTREIGILRAVGATQAKMLHVFLLQGALFGFIGSMAGSILGYGLVRTFNAFGPRLFRVPVSLRLILTAMLLAILTGVLAASVPARRAARLDPVTAIRHV